MDVEQQELSFTAGGNAKRCRPFERQAVSYKPARTLTLRCLRNDLKTYIHAKSCTGVFIEALFIIAQTWKQPGCPLIGEWINKLACPYNGMLFSNIKGMLYQALKDIEP